MIFPVSAAIVRDQRSYDAVLESFSQPLFSAIEWGWTSDREIAVRNDTAQLYRFFDAMPGTEYLYDRVVDTVRTDLREELASWLCSTARWKECAQLSIYRTAAPHC